jgi:hypothetical protein
VSHQRLDLLITKQIGDRTLALRVEDTQGWEFMTGIGGPTKAGKANDDLQASGALGFRTGLPSPRNCSLRHDMGISLGRGKPGETV